MKVVFSDRAYLAVLAETSEKIATETGGIFLGCFEGDAFYIVEAIDPGPKSTFQVAYFEYDQKYTQHLINKIARLYEHKLTLVGLWHRHPGSFDKFSSTDDGTNRQYAQLNACGALSVLVNIDPEFRVTAYHVSNPLKYQRIPHEIGDELIPEHIRRHKTIEDTLEYINGYEKRRASPKKTVPSRENLDHLMNLMKPRFQIFNYADAEIEHAEADISGVRDYLTDSLLDDLSFLTETRGILLEVRQDEKCITVSQKDGTAKLYFTYIQTMKKIIFSYCDTCFVYSSGLFSKLLGDNASALASNQDISWKDALMKLLGIDSWR